MVLNPKEVDTYGKKIKEGDTVVHSQYACSIFAMDMEFENQKDADIMASLYTSVNKEDMEFRLYNGNEYRLYYKASGIPYVMNCPELIGEKNVFSISSEYDIPEIDVKRGDPVLVIGGEGWARGVCRFEPYSLKIV